MGFRIGSVFTTTLINTAINASDVIVLTTPPLIIPADNTAVEILWTVNMATGAGGTSCLWKLSRGTVVSGSPLMQQTNTPAASSNIILGGCFVDTPGVATGVQYTISINDAGGAGVVSSACMIALAL